MFRIRSFTFAAAAVLVAGVTTAVCCGEALQLVAAKPLPVQSAIAAAPADASAQPLSALSEAEPWLTAVPGGVAALRGKVVVVNFWTYSCINSLRALPALRAWDQRYRDKGLVVIGVHAPEFAFEKDSAKVRAALRDLDVRYPNVQDNHYATWQRFGNEGWPGFYFIDAKGAIRGYRLGEGHYDEAELLIRTLLTEAGQDVSGIRPAPPAGTGIQAEADWKNLRSPESYLGYAKAGDFESPDGLRRDVAHRYQPAASLLPNHWDLAGAWSIGREFATLGDPTGAIRYRFHARDLHLVLGGAADGQPVRFRVLIDGAPPGASHGADVDAAGWGEVRQDRLYQLVRMAGVIADRTVTVAFTRPGVRAYVFTFG
ncbi:redoxin domain-containing protein [Sphingomonas sp. H39-1-10]|uniref:redoxin domain-containing protein n=1 Tax=Sphingomonas pollutisoli TaxID=3030829 RepID=UPI0023B98008|nr:redoxin domain-containing protein [Sphingomonas pollutisoli]MDF0486740.1 redoxin domain-containing protein [Sphingomonas pollutisoli]